MSRAFTVSTHGTIRKFDSIDEAKQDVADYGECFKGLAPRQVFDHFPSESEYDEYLKMVEAFENDYQRQCQELRGELTPDFASRWQDVSTFEHPVSLDELSAEFKLVDDERTDAEVIQDSGLFQTV